VAEGWAVARANATLDAELAASRWIQLHVGAPGAAGTSNIAQETTRKQATWGAANAAAATTSADLTWTNVAADEQYTHWSRWTASTAGTFYGSGVLSADPVAAGNNFTIGAGNLTVTAQNIAS